MPVIIRPWIPADTPAIAALLHALWGHDSIAADHFAVHGPARDEPGAFRCTVVASSDHEPVGVGTLWENGLHPARWRVTIHVRAADQRHGIGSALLARLAALSGECDARPLQAATRASDVAGCDFLGKHGFALLMRTRLGMLAPRNLDPATWQVFRIAAATVTAAGYRLIALPDLPAGVGRQVADLHTEVYRRDHAAWNPVAPLSEQDAGDLFLGDDLIPPALFVAVVGNEPVAVASLRHGDAPTTVDLGWVGVTERCQADGPALTAALIGCCLTYAAERNWRISLEVDEAAAHLWRLAARLPAAWAPDWLTFAQEIPARVP